MQAMSRTLTALAVATTIYVSTATASAQDDWEPIGPRLLTTVLSYNGTYRIKEVIVDGDNKTGASKELEGKLINLNFADEKNIKFALHLDKDDVDGKGKVLPFMAGSDLQARPVNTAPEQIIGFTVWPGAGLAKKETHRKGIFTKTAEKEWVLCLSDKGSTSRPDKFESKKGDSRFLLRLTSP